MHNFYPVDPLDAHIRCMKTVRGHFGVDVGLSDHNLGIGVSIAATALGAQVFSESDDYSGNRLTNPTVYTKFKKPICSPVTWNKHVIIGDNSVVFPGVEIGEGTALGSITLVNSSLETWGIYSSIPARRIKERTTRLFDLEAQYLEELGKKSEPIIHMIDIKIFC